MDGKVAVVTGASSGIGESTARRLAGLGFTVYAAARRVERMAALSQIADQKFRVPHSLGPDAGALPEVSVERPVWDV
jgi:NADP-dependent 3-hydroxy acid dehydrogenase YdfG